MNNIYIEGYPGRKIFQSGDFKIYAFFPLDKYLEDVVLNEYGNISIKGEMPDLYEGNVYKIEVEYQKVNGYDNYIVKRFYQESGNIDKNGTIKFLEAINITQNQISELIKYYPDIIDRVINEKEIDVNKLYGIKDKTMNVIRRKIMENFKLMELVTEFYDYGMTFSMIKKLYNEFTSIELIRKAMKVNPYLCLCKISGIGFKTADKFILKKYPDRINSRERADACIFYSLKENELNGHSYIDLLGLYAKFKDLAPECSEWFNKVLNKDNTYYIDESQDSKKVSLKETFKCEKEISEMIKKLLRNDKTLNIDCSKYDEVDGIPLTEEQMGVHKNLCNYNISILAGYGGSGKSFCTKSVIQMLDENRLTYILMSPTAKAAKVLKEYSGKKASTIHRGLGSNPDGFYYNEDNKLPYNVVIIDEFSMIDIYLLRNLLHAIDLENTKILFIGDPAQIPSVGVGNVAHDMINSDIIPITVLTKVFRYNEGGLSYVATKTRNGENYIKGDKNIEVFGKNKDYAFINIGQEKSIDCIKTLYNKLYFKEGVPIDDIMVLSAYNKGNYGTTKINSIIQDLINPKTDTKNEISYKINNDDTVVLREGDKVMQTKNNYKAIKISDNGEMTETIVVNGDIGNIVKVKNDCVYVNIDGETIFYDKGDLHQLVLAYSISIHKAQGGSAKYVIMITPKAHKFFLDRNLLYVADTRGIKRVYHIGTPDVIRSSLKKSQNFSRNTFLKKLLTNK